MNKESEQITGVVLAGGRARRMGGADKGLLQFRGRPLVAYALDALRQVTGTILINANRNQADYARFGYPVIGDLTDRFDGPLAGLLSAMQAAQTDYVLTLPCDCPNVDGALLSRLYASLTSAGAEVCAAHDGERLQSLVLIVKRELHGDLAQYLASGQRKVETWLRMHTLAVADYRDHPELFANLNTLEDFTLLGE